MKDDQQVQNMKGRHSRSIMILRWLAVLPASSFTYFLGSMFFAEVLLILFPGSSYLRAEVPDTEGLINALFLGKTLSSFFYVLVGAYTAPTRHFMVAVLLTIIPVTVAIITIGGFVTLVYLDSNMSLSEGLSMIDSAHIEAVVGAALAILACVLIRRSTQNRIE